jgi:hypothetical protein
MDLVRHEFELASTGDEVSSKDLGAASWRVVETFVGIDYDGAVCFTHRIELHQTDDQLIAYIPKDPTS